VTVVPIGGHAGFLPSGGGLGAHRRAHPSVPVIVEVTEPQAKALGHLLDGCHQVAFPFTKLPLVSAVADAVSGRPGTALT